MKQLVESWIKAEKHYYGNTQAGAIQRMMQVTGQRITHSRVSEWKRGKYCPSANILSEMLWRTLPWALRQAGIYISAPQQDKIDTKLWVFTGEGDQRKRYTL